MPFNYNDIQGSLRELYDGSVVPLTWVRSPDFDTITVAPYDPEIQTSVDMLIASLYRTGGIAYNPQSYRYVKASQEQSVLVVAEDIKEPIQFDEEWV